MVILDVRSPQEYKENHLDNSINIPVYEINKKVSSIIKDKETRILVYCQTGERSKKAVGILYKLGYHNVYDLEGGLDKM